MKICGNGYLGMFRFGEITANGNLTDNIESNTLVTSQIASTKPKYVRSLCGQI